MYIKLIMTTGLITAMVAGTALADNDGKKRGEDRGKDRLGSMIEKIDTDKSGTISQEEFAAIGMGKVVAADANGDGELTVEEIVAQMEAERMKRRANSIIKRLDADGDGKLTVAEIEDTQAKRFALLDGNNDGSLSEEELRKMRGSRKGSKRDR